jgi:hypothetical protein
VTAARSMNWRDYKFHLFDRNPQIFAAFESSLEELQSVVFDFSERKKYTLTRHALSELRTLISAYLIARDHALRVPSSTMAMFFPSEMRFDPLLTRQLERFKAHAARGISNSDQEFVKQIVLVLSDLSIASLQSRSYFAEQGENSVTTFVSAFLYGSIQDAAIRRLDDVSLEGADHLRDLCKALIDRRLYVSGLTQIGNLEKLATISVFNGSDVVLSVALRSLCDCLLHNCTRGHPHTHITSHLLESLFRLTNARLASPLGLDTTQVEYSVGPFVNPAERSSFAGITVAVVNGIATLSRSDDWETLGRLRSVHEELHDRAWLDFAELGIEAVKKNSFLLHYINSTLQEVVRAFFYLFNTLEELPRIEERDLNTAREQDRRDRFRDEVEDKIGWSATGVYSRIIHAMFEHQQLNYLQDTIKNQALFAFWAMKARVEKVAVDATERIFSACAQLQDRKYDDVYDSARLAMHIAQIGIYAIALEAQPILVVARERYATLRRTFREKYPDFRFSGDFESAERELLEGGWARGAIIIDRHDQDFFQLSLPTM